MNLPVTLSDGPARGIAMFGQALGTFGLRGWLVALAAAGSTLALVGVTTAIIENPLFVRMTPTRDQDYAIWVATAALVGLIAGTYVVSMGTNQNSVATGGLLSAFAVGCPICNKLVVFLIGTSGALTFFAPLQLYLGLGALALLLWTLWLRVSSIPGHCAIT